MISCVYFTQQTIRTSLAYKIVGLLLSCLICFNTAIASENNKEIVILYDDSQGTLDISDITSISPDSRMPYHTIGNVLPQKYGFNIRLKPIIWSRGLELLKTGMADGILDASYQDERAEYSVYPMKDGKLDPSRSLRNSYYYLYYNKSSQIQWDGQKLSNFEGPIGSIQSYSIVKDLRAKGINVLEMQREVGILKDVYIGKLDAAALPEGTGTSVFKRFPYLKDNILTHKTPLTTKTYYLIFSKHFYEQNTGVAENIWNAYREYKNTKEYKTLEDLHAKHN